MLSVFSVTQQNSDSPAYVPYTFPCERIDPSAGAARYTIPKQVALQTTEDSQTTTHHPLLVNDDPVKDDANATKGFGKSQAMRKRVLCQKRTTKALISLSAFIVRCLDDCCF